MQDISQLEAIWVNGLRVPITEDESAGLILRAPDSTLGDLLAEEMKAAGISADADKAFVLFNRLAAANGYIQGWWGFVSNGEPLADRTEDGALHGENFERLMRLPPVVMRIWRELHDLQMRGWDDDIIARPKAAEVVSDAAPTGEEPTEEAVAAGADAPAETPAAE